MESHPLDSGDSWIDADGPARIEDAAGSRDRPRATPVGQGHGVSAGIATGELHVDVDDALDAIDAGRSVIIALETSSPGDVALMVRAAGVITVLGTAEGHTAVVTRAAGVPAVVSVGGLSIEIGGVKMGEELVSVGTLLIIDGTYGMIWMDDE